MIPLYTTVHWKFLFYQSNFYFPTDRESSGKYVGKTCSGILCNEVFSIFCFVLVQVCFLISRMRNSFISENYYFSRCNRIEIRRVRLVNIFRQSKFLSWKWIGVRSQVSKWKSNTITALLAVKWKSTIHWLLPTPPSLTVAIHLAKCKRWRYSFCIDLYISSIK